MRRRTQALLVPSRSGVPVGCVCSDATVTCTRICHLYEHQLGWALSLTNTCPIEDRLWNWLFLLKVSYAHTEMIRHINYKRKRPLTLHLPAFSCFSFDVPYRKRGTTTLTPPAGRPLVQIPLDTWSLRSVLCCTM